MNGKTYINGDELTALANGLKAKSENILNSYKGDCSQAIQMSSECLQLSGLNTADFFQALEKIYTQVNERINSFADFLTNVVVAEYSAVAEAISNNFNGNFASEISSLLGIPVALKGGAIAPAIPGKPIPLDPEYPPVDRFQPGIKKPEDELIYIDPRESEGFADPLTPGLGDNKISDPVIELDPREKEGFNDPVIKELDDSKIGEPVIELDPREKEGFKDPIINDGGIPKGPIESTNTNKGNNEIRAVEMGEGNTFTAATSGKPTVKPDLPPLPEATTKAEINSTPTPVYFNEGSAPSVAPIKPNSQVQATIAAPAPAAPVVKPPKPTVKPNLPPLPTKPVSSGGSFSRGSAISGGGGGGGMGAANIAFDSGLTNPLHLRF